MNKSVSQAGALLAKKRYSQAVVEKAGFDACYGADTLENKTTSGSWVFEKICEYQIKK